MATKKQRQRIGRPPAGGEGQHVRKFPMLALRVPKLTRNTLRRLALKESRPMWHVLVAAVGLYDLNEQRLADARKDFKGSKRMRQLMSPEDLKRALGQSYATN